MRYQYIVPGLSDSRLKSALAVLVTPVVLACGILSDDPAPSPTSLASESPSLASERSPQDGEPGTGTEFEPRATPFPTATPYPTATPFPTATPYPAAAPLLTSPTPTPAVGNSSHEATPIPTPEAAPVASTLVPTPPSGVAPTPAPIAGSGQLTIPEKTDLRYPKVGSMLDELIARVEAGEISAEDAAGEAPLHRGESVAVTVHLSGNVDGVVRFLQDNGVSPRNVGEDYIEAFIPIPLLPQTSEQSGVLRVEVVIPAESFQSDQPIAGNGPAAHGSSAWNQAEYRGQGIKVGIIDGGFDGFSGLMGTELPQSVQARCYPEDSDTTTDEVADCEWDGDHGTIVAESVMDISPEVALYIANPLTGGDLQAAVQWMIGQGVDVINHSVGWTFDGPGDGMSPYSWSPLKSVDRAVDSGIVWVNSAGNEARTTWFGSPSDADGDGAIEFAMDDEKYDFDLYPSALTVQLRWDDSWSGAVRDLDFYIYDRDDGRKLGKSDRKQSGSNGETPFESLSGGGSGRFYIGVVNRSSSMPSWIQLTLWGDIVVEHYTDNGSITNPAESRNPGMLTVGAAHWSNVSSIESYSSRGPTPDGRLKPDLVAAACGRTTYDSEFCGTSQASPHVAGMAALVRQRFPDFTPAQVASYLKENAEQRISSPDPNNTWGHGFIVLPPITADVASLSDLVVDAPTIDTGVPAAGASFTLSATVRNQGSGRSDSTTLRYYQSTDPTITNGDTEVGTDSVSSIDASKSEDESISLAAPSTPGNYYYGGCVDSVDDESDATNNCSAAVTVTVGAAPAPDLVVDAPTIDTGVPAAGASFTLSATVRNQGNGRSDSTTLRYYQSTDSTITTGDTEVGTDSVSSLDASETGNESISLAAPSTPGNYYYGACVDSVSDESDTTNNCSAAVTVTVGAAPAPDLVVDAPTASEGAPAAGARFTLSATVRNQGSGRSDSTTLRYYQSVDSAITTGDTEVGTDSVFRLDASSNGDESISLTAPSTAGTYYYGACVDAVSDESDTTNNCSPAVTVTVGAAPAPDLVVDAPTVSESAPAAGATFTLSATVRNQGNGRSDSTTLRYYRSTDSTITTDDTEVGTDSVSSLDAAESGDESISLTAPSSAGTYYYGACVDSLSDESDTTNNCLAAVTVTVGAASAPDLVVDTPTVSEGAPAAGARFTLSATVRNQGSGRSDSATLRYYRSTDSTITTDDTEVGTDFVFGLDASESGAESVSLTAPDAPGTYYYGACVDAVSGESDTQNNCSSAVTVTVGALASVPGAPTGLMATANGQTQIDLSWNAPSDNAGAAITGYRVEVSTNGTTWSDLVGDTRSTATSNTHSGLMAGGTRYYQVSAINSVGTGPASNVANATTDSSTTPPGETSACATGSAVPDAANNPGLVADCDTLLAARDTLRGTATLNWSASTSISQWDGITVGGTPPRVTSLAISRSRVTGRLTGMIPPELANLANLTTLKLSENRLTGRIPPELGNLTNLTTLNLWDNQLTGSIPVQLGDLSNLRLLILNNNQLNGRIPSELGELDKLTVLNLRHNRLSGAIPSELSGLTSLIRLNFLDNQLTGSIPSELGSIRSLERLEINGNQLTGSIPPALGNLANLTQLEVNHNRLSGEIPAELGNLTNLTTLNLHNNRLTGSIPPELGRLAQLQHLNLAGNQLSGCIPPGLLTVQFNDFASLGLLDCAEDPPTDVTCATGGAVANAATNPGLVADCDALLSARVTLRGTATLDWSPSTAIEDWDGVTLGGMPQRVTKLNIASRGLLGTVPTELGNLTNLRELLLSVNNLTGAIPSELGNLSNLETLIMGNNNLTGEIPSALGNLTNLARLLFNSNQLSGEIPAELGNLANLRELNLGWNRLSGNIPSELGNLSKLESLTLTVNRLSGCVPAALKGQLRSYLFDRHIDFCSISTAPDAPTGLMATADGETEIDLSWTAPSDNGGADITGYKIEVSTDGSSWSDLAADTRSATTSYSDTSLTAGTTRHYRVSAINSAGTGPASGSDSATTDEEPVSDATCTVNLIVEPGESCVYPGTSAEFSVDSDGTGRFLIASSGSGIELRSTDINGVTYTFVASKQSDGNWLVEEVE